MNSNLSARDSVCAPGLSADAWYYHKSASYFALRVAILPGIYAAAITRPVLIKRDNRAAAIKCVQQMIRRRLRGRGNGATMTEWASRRRAMGRPDYQAAIGAQEWGRGYGRGCCAPQAGGLVKLGCPFLDGWCLLCHRPRSNVCVCVLRSISISFV